MEELLELQKMILDKISETPVETASLSTASCDHHSCNGSSLQSFELLESIMSIKPKK